MARTEAPPPDEVRRRWPYNWLPSDRAHALYEAKVGGGLYVGVGVLILVMAASELRGSDGLGQKAFWLTLIVAGLAQVANGLRYSTFCFWWGGVNPWWMRVEWTRPLRVVARHGGRTVQAVDAFGNRWTGLIAVLSLAISILGVVFFR